MRKFYKSMTFQIAAALFGQFLFLTAIVIFTMYELNLRKHDYAILNLTGQLRVLTQVMVKNSFDLIRPGPFGKAPGKKESLAYKNNMKVLLAQYDKIITGFKERRLSPELTGRDEPLICNWDEESKSQLKVTANAWDKFYPKGLETPDSLDGQSLALYIIRNEKTLADTSQHLAKAFQNMMEGKLAQVQFFLRTSIVLSVVIGILVLLLLFFKAYRPLQQTLYGFERVGNGDLNFQIKVSSENEVGYLTSMFNKLTDRLKSIFHLTDKINTASNLDETLQFVFEEFRGFLPIDWVALIQSSPDDTQFQIERVYTDLEQAPPEGLSIAAENTGLRRFSDTALQIHDSAKNKDDAFLTALFDSGLNSAILLPIVTSGARPILVFAARQKNAYGQEHMDLLKNIRAQLTHAIQKSIGMESLIISAIAGLAKLAESRDPETGDHLNRMSLYSVILAEQASRLDKYKKIITPAYIRSIYRFAPMHDIGKVGVPDYILLKPGKLTQEERTQMELHPVIGGEVLKRCENQMEKSGFRIFTVGIEIAEGHHEKYDGTGYPFQIRGEKIPLSARIIAIADVFDALTSKRPYKEAWPVEKALKVMKEESGRHFDPQLIDCFEKAMPHILLIYERYKHV